MWKGRGEPDRRRELFGGRGEVRVWSLVDDVVAPFDCVLGCELDPGGRVGEHVQSDCSEIVVVTEGTGEATVSGNRHPLRPGVVVTLPLGTSLSLVNRSRRSALRYLIIKARP